MSERFGIWYDDGRYDCGWLAHEGRHGRQSTATYLSLEEAEEAAKHQRRYDATTVFYPALIASDTTALAKTVQKLAREMRIARTERELKMLKGVTDDDEPAVGDERPTAWDRVKKT